MEFDQPARDRESDAQTALCAVEPGFRLCKQVPDERQHLERDTDAGIPDKNRRLIILALGNYVDTAAWLGVLCGV